jgi:hypothetical protein
LVGKHVVVLRFAAGLPQSVGACLFEIAAIFVVERRSVSLDTSSNEREPSEGRGQSA